jgi:hypothetical protein
MVSHVFRTTARDFAVKQGWTNFRTRLDPINRVWKATYEPGENPAAAFAQGKDWIRWIETTWQDIDGVKHRLGVCVVSITEQELQQELAALGGAPEGIIFEPQTPDLWSTTRGSDSPIATTRQANGRAKSEIESPVKVVWRIADEMKGKSRAEVIAACVAEGVNKSTASTQFYRWQQAQKT